MQTFKPTKILFTTVWTAMMLGTLAISACSKNSGITARAVTEGDDVPDPALPLPLPTGPLTGLFSFQGNIYYANGTGYCRYTDLAHYTRATGNKTLGNTTALSALPALHDDGTCGDVPNGFFKKGTTIFFSNGNDAFCEYSSLDHYARVMDAVDISKMLEVAALPAFLRHDKYCQDLPIREGLFSVAGRYYFSNGTDYCYFAGKTHVIEIYKTETPAPTRYFSTMPPLGKQVAMCGVKEGFFAVGNALHYSNGVSAFCSFKSNDHFFRYTGGFSLPTVTGFPELPGMRNDGYCVDPVIPRGLFRVAGNIYMSNGVEAFCKYGPDALYIQRTGDYNVPYYGYSAVPPAMRNDGSCVGWP